MRVLLVTGSFPPDRCGVGDYTFNLARALSSLPEVKVAVLTSVSSKGVPSESPMEVFSLIFKWHLSEIGILAQVIRRWSPHIVHVQYPTQGYVHNLMPSCVPMVSFLMGRKVVQTWHEGYRHRQMPWLFLRAMVPSRIIVTRQNYRTLLAPLLRGLLWRKRLEWIGIASNIPKCALSEEEVRVLHGHYVGEQKRLVVFFGFVYRHKGVERLFTIADPATDQIIIAGGTNPKDPYAQEIRDYTQTTPWKGKATVLEFLPLNDIATLLAAADAVILPFREGGGEGNGSLHAARLQGTFVLTTSKTKRGYDERQNVYYAQPDDLDEMRTALNTHAGTRRVHPFEEEDNAWTGIATAHQAVYEKILSEPS